MDLSASRVQGMALGHANVYLVGQPGAYILVDAGAPGKERRFFAFLKVNAIEPREIKLIVITHVHYDHVGCAAAIREACGCPVMVHQKEARILAAGEVVIPPGVTPWGKTLGFLGEHAKGLLRFPAVKPDVLIASHVSLREYGVTADVIPTPGHTEGSVSVVLPEGEACVGDLVSGWRPLLGAQVMTVFAQDPDGVFRSWEMLLKMGVHTFYPAHGRPITSGMVRQRLEKLAPMRQELRVTPAGEEA